MPSFSEGKSPAAFFTFPFRWRRQSYELNSPDAIYNVTYLGNVLTLMAKGEESIEKPLSIIWRTYLAKKRANQSEQFPDITMKLRVTRSGLKAETKLLGLTEYWAHRITYCTAPSNFPRVFCWIYKHEGRRMKPELRCHAVLCKKVLEPQTISNGLQIRLKDALMEYKREKLATERARKYSSYSAGGTLLPSRKLLLQTGTLNFRPPVSRSKSVPRLNSIDEVDEQEELSTFEEDEELFLSSDTDSAMSYNYRTTPLGSTSDRRSFEGLAEEDNQSASSSGASSAPSSSSVKNTDKNNEDTSSGVFTTSRNDEDDFCEHEFSHFCSIISSTPSRPPLNGLNLSPPPDFNLSTPGSTTNSMLKNYLVV